jgi:glycosyltransferase involved in cell wall biosynthesis
LPPARDTILAKEHVERARMRVLQLADMIDWPTMKTRMLVDDVAAGRAFFGADAYLPAYYDELAPLSDYLPDDTRFVLTNPSAITRVVLDELGRATIDAAAKASEPQFLPSTFFVSDAEVTRRKAVDYGMEAACTAVFPWGVDLTRFKPALRTARSGSEPFILFCNRNWEPLYGVAVLARAFARVAQQRDDVSLLLLGDGSQAQAIRQILLSGHALERVQFGGQVPQADLARWYRMADLYISPSHVDGSSVSLMEALACGLPALVSDIPGNREWVSDGVNGWLFPDGDPQALADRILAVMAQRDALPAIRQAARRTAEERADWPRNFAVLLRAYDQAVQAAG